MLYFISIATYIGFVPWASHWWADVRDNDGEHVYDNLSKQYKTEKEAVGDAIDWFVRERKKGDVLIKGLYASCDPSEVLRGPKKFKEAANALWRKAEKMGRWEGDERGMAAICRKWDALMKASIGKE